MSVRNAIGNCSAEGKKTPAAGVVLSSDCWICSCVFGYLNAHSYADSCELQPLSRLERFLHEAIFGVISTGFRPCLLFQCLCLVFLLTPLFWFWCDSSNYAIIYVYLSVCHCVRVSALSAHLQVDQNTEIFSGAPGKHTTHQTTTQNWNVALYPVIEQ